MRPRVDEKKTEPVIRILRGDAPPEHTHDEKALSGSFSRTLINLRLQMILALKEKADELLGPKMRAKLEQRGMIAQIQMHLITTLGSGNLGDKVPLSPKNNVAFAHMIATYQKKLERYTWRNTYNRPIGCRDSHLCSIVGHNPFCDAHNVVNKPKTGDSCLCCRKQYQPGEVIISAEDNPGIQDDAIRILKVLFHQISRAILSEQTNIPVTLIQNNQLPFYGQPGRFPISRKPMVQQPIEEADETTEIQESQP